MGNRASHGEQGEERHRRLCHRPSARRPEPLIQGERRCHDSPDKSCLGGQCQLPCADRPRSPKKEKPRSRPHSPNKERKDRSPNKMYINSNSFSRVAGSLVGVRCAERHIPSSGSREAPVRLVVFDLDETLTITTFMSRDGAYTPEQHEFTAKINFESPWVEGSRIERLQQMFKELKQMKDGRERTLAILTRNDNQGGVLAVVNLLRVAGLSEYFAAVWSLPWRSNLPNGAYQAQAGHWTTFDPPVNKILDHKAHVLQHIGDNLRLWLPHLGQEGGPALPQSLALEEMILVDDQRANFQSSMGAKVLRYCKVARYDAVYYDFGLLKDMGGIGARDPRDYELLVRFVEDPQDFEESLECSCAQLDGSGRRPVSLVIFDFDETLTLATFMPEEEECQTQVGWTPSMSPNCEWNEADLVEYNFESPWLLESRVAKLKAMLSKLTVDASGHRRTFVVMTRNQHSAVGVLNLLMLAGLAEHFSAVWRIPSPEESADGVYFQAGKWQAFDLPLRPGHEEPLAAADVLHHITEHPADWLPQLKSEDGGGLDPCLLQLPPQEIVLVDDERANFWSNCCSGAMVMRYCKVTRYDRNYRDCGFLHNMGGIGANSLADFATVEHFVRCPWDFPYKGSRPQTILPADNPMIHIISAGSGDLTVPSQSSLPATPTEVFKTMTIKVPTMRRERASTAEEPKRTPRRRGTLTQSEQLRMLRQEADAVAAAEANAEAGADVPADA